MVLVARRGRLYVLPPGQLLTMSSGLAKNSFCEWLFDVKNGFKFCAKLCNLCSSKIFETHLQQITMIPI